MDPQIAKDQAFGALNFDFGFNDPRYSDCILRIRVMSPVHEDHGQERPNSAGDFLVVKEEEMEYWVMEDGASVMENPNRDHLPPFSAHGFREEKRSRCSESEDAGIQGVSTFHVNSLLFSAHSPFFRQLFTNGMRESQQKEATINVNNLTEEFAVLDLLRYMYTGRVQATEGKELLNVIEAAEKFGAVYCIQYCVRLLLIKPMTIKCAVMCMQLPATVLCHDAVQPLVQAATLLLINHFKDFKRSHKEALSLPLEGVKALLASDQLEVDSEDEIYDFVMAWAKAHHGSVVERIMILSSSLGHLIRFPMMTTRTLRLLQSKLDVETLAVSRFVSEAFVYKAESLHKQKKMAREQGETHRFVPRAYKILPLKVIEFENPYMHFILYLNIQKKACMSLGYSGELVSECFDLEGRNAYLKCQHVGGGQQQEMFLLDLCSKNSRSLPCRVECKFSARSKVLGQDFYRLHSTVHKYKGGRKREATGLLNPFKTYWHAFVADSSQYFIDDVLYLRVEIALV